jgi:hypothetical protein
MEDGDDKSNPASTVQRKPSTYRGVGVGQKEKVSSTTTQPKAKATQKAKVEAPEVSATKPKAKAKTAPKAASAKPTTTQKKKKSNLDSLLADIRKEEVELDEKTLTDAETKKKEKIVKSMKDKKADFEKRYPGRGKEVMYATATKMAKKMESYEPEGEQIDEILGTGRVVAGQTQPGVNSGSKYTRAGTVQKVLGVTVPGSFNPGVSQSDVKRYNQKASPNTQIKPTNQSKDQDLGYKSGGQTTVGITPDKIEKPRPSFFKKPVPTATSTSTSSPSATPTPKPTTASDAMQQGLKGVPFIGAVADIAKKYDDRINYRNQSPEIRKQMGLQNSYEQEGDQIDEIAPLVAGGIAAGVAAVPYLVKKFAAPAINKSLDNASKDPNRRLVTGGTVGDLNKTKGL